MLSTQIVTLLNQVSQIHHRLELVGTKPSVVLMLGFIIRAELRLRHQFKP